MKSLAMGLLAVAGLVTSFFNPPAGLMILTITGCWFWWELG
jgi:hypothetical protein